MGDSVTAGANEIRDIEETINMKLEGLFTGQKVEVLNFGVNGYCTQAEIELLKERGLKYNPDLVLLLFVNNDYVNMNNDLGVADSGLPTWFRFLFIKSHFFRFFSLKINLLDINRKLGINDFAGKHMDTLTQSALDKVRTARDPGQMTIRNHMNSIEKNNVLAGLKMLKHLSQNNSFNVMIGIWPVFTDRGIFDVETAYDGQIKKKLGAGEELIIEKLAQELQIPSFRFSPFFIDELKKHQSRGEDISARLYFAPDQMHPNKNGTALAAKIIKMVLDQYPYILNKPK